MKNADIVLYSYFVESELMSESEFQDLTEETKIESIRRASQSALSNINDTLEAIDTTFIDRSRGDIKQIRELELIQECLTNLERLVNAAGDLSNTTLGKDIGEIIKCIFHLNQYSSQFKEAYRTKKSLLILKYQSLIFAIISSISYLISVAVDFKNGGLGLKTKCEIEEIAPIKTIKEFNRSVESGEFGIIVKDMMSLREYYTELSLDQMSTILEANDVISLVVNGMSSMAQDLNNGGQLSSLLFKAAGVVVLILSMRELFYALYRAKNKISDNLDNMRNFVKFDGSQTTSAISKLITYNNKNVFDAEEATKMAIREIETEDRGIATNIKKASSEMPQDFVQSPVKQSNAPETGSNILDF